MREVCLDIEHRRTCTRIGPSTWDRTWCRAWLAARRSGVPARSTLHHDAINRSISQSIDGSNGVARKASSQTCRDHGHDRAAVLALVHGDRRCLDRRGPHARVNRSLILPI